MWKPRQLQAVGAAALCASVAASVAGCSGKVHDAGSDVPDPGRVTLRRLNRIEYNSTVRDLLGTTLRPADDFPADDRGYGFDHIGDVLSLSPVLVEGYARAAERLVEDTLGGAAAPKSTRFEIETIGASAGAAEGEGWNLYSEGSADAVVNVPTAGRYRIAARAYGQPAGPELPRMTLTIDGIAPVSFEVAATAAAPRVYETTAMLGPGTKTLSVAFVNDFYDEAAMLDRNLWVDWIELHGPIDAAPADPARRSAVLFCEIGSDAGCVSAVLRRFARRAWRRPISDAEAAALVAIVDATTSRGGSVEAGVRLALEAVLVSPYFIFRVELDPAPNQVAPHRLSDHELAVRLSYFLWSTMPDAELDAAADAGRLHEPEVLRAQAERLLADERARALVDNFAGQWLFTRALAEHVPDPVAYPSYDAELVAAMREETERLFLTLLREDRPIQELLTADYTFVNDRLAAHYGLPLPGSAALVQVSLGDAPRRGVLTHGSLLTVNSYPQRTSPVKRGKWVLENLLCDPPPPPPPGVDGLPEGNASVGSIRDRLEAHRQVEICASCHTRMDPWGFGLDHFDPVGRFRTEDQGYPIDATGEIDGLVFDGAVEMAERLAQDPRFPRCVTERLWIYAQGRGPEADAAKAAIDDLRDQFAAAGYRFHDLVIAVVMHSSFGFRRGEP